jgi:hypothetical protein
MTSRPATLHPDTLHVGDIATGTTRAHHGPVVRVEHFGPCDAWCCLTFADRVEVTVTPDTVWEVAA